MEDIKENKSVFPKVPFTMVILEKDYAERYCLPYKVALTVTHIRYSVREKEIRYTLVNALFDFPWDDKSCEVLELCPVN